MNLCVCVGCKIKALRAKTNTYIKTPVRGEEPVFAISGRPEHVTTAKWEIVAAAEHFSQIRASRCVNSPNNLGGSADDKVTIHVRVPYRVVGLVVGPKGATVKRIQQVTQTYIVTPSRDKEPCFEVKGTPENVQRARKEIESYIALRTGNSIIDDFSPPSSDGVFSSPDTFSLSQKMQQCQLSDSNIFQFPGHAPSSISLAGESFESVCSKVGGHVEDSGRIQWRPPATIFSGMRFTPPDNSYQPMSAPLLTPEKVFDNSRQPLSPTGSYESNSSDGFAATSPKQSPLSLKRGLKACCICKSEDEMAALLPCRHNIFCQNCAHYIACSSGSCPLCNTQVTNVMHI